LEELENAEDKVFLVLMEKYLKDKGTSDDFVEKIKKKYDDDDASTQREEIRALLSKLMNCQSFR